MAESSFFFERLVVFQCIIKSIVMKKLYLSPVVREAGIKYEVNFMTSPVGIGGSTGEDLDPSGDVVDPWS